LQSMPCMESGIPVTEATWEKIVALAE